MRMSVNGWSTCRNEVSFSNFFASVLYYIQVPTKVTVALIPRTFFVQSYLLFFHNRTKLDNISVETEITFIG